MRLLLMSTDTMGPCELVLCAPEDVLSTASEFASMGAQGFEDITDDPERCKEMLSHFEKSDLNVVDDVRAFIEGLD